MRVFFFFNIKNDYFFLKKGLELSRRDDIQSLLYLLVYLLKGELP